MLTVGEAEFEGVSIIPIMFLIGRLLRNLLSVQKVPLSPMALNCVRPEAFSSWITCTSAPWIRKKARSCSTMCSWFVSLRSLSICCTSSLEGQASGPSVFIQRYPFLARSSYLSATAVEVSPTAVAAIASIVRTFIIFILSSHAHQKIALSGRAGQGFVECAARRE